jgi:hypothetical protein
MESRVGTFGDSLTLEANDNGWMVTSMQDDLNRFIPSDQPTV